jgi:DNA-binding PadR family transcriptional regulator
MARLSLTSYAVLALLAERPYTGYELTRLIRVGFSQCMPRSTRGVYNEPKLLVEHGYATATEELKGRQKRTMYRITPSGRRALKAWLRSPTAPPLFESETMVRLIIGHVGRRADLVAALGGIEGQVQELTQRAGSEMPGWLETVGAGPEHLDNLALMARFYTDFHALLVSWSRWAGEQIQQRPERWPPDAAQQAMAALAQAMAPPEADPAGKPARRKRVTNASSATADADGAARRTRSERPRAGTGSPAGTRG